MAILFFAVSILQKRIVLLTGGIIISRYYWFSSQY